MLLVFDIGNTNIVAGLYENKTLVSHWRISSDKDRTIDEYGVLLKQLFDFHGIKAAIDKAIIASVVPNLTGTLKGVVERYFGIKPLVVGQGLKTGLVIRYENPKEVGADRVVNAVAAIEKYGTPLVLVDFGTATTFCAINKAGEYLGGAIAPGIGISTDALFQRTAKLPKVELMVPKNAIGRNTVNAIQSGLIFGYCGLVDGMVKRFKKELGEGAEETKVIATGGLADMLKAHTETIDLVDQDLTLEGLRILYERNASER